MAKLIEVATRVMDLYYQNYTPNDKFLDIDDFKFQVAITYSAALNSLYQVERRANKQIEGFSNIEIPAAWLIEENIKIEYQEEEDRYIAKLSYPVFSFDFDNSANALQGVHSFGNAHKIYRKISLNERRFRQIIPPSSATFFYLNAKKEIVFWDAEDGAKIKVQYVPEVVGAENDCLLSDNVISTLEIQVLDTMFKAKNGNFIQKADDQNPTVAAPQGDPVLK